MVTRRKPLAMKLRDRPFHILSTLALKSCDNFSNIISLSADNNSFDLRVNVRDLYVFGKRLVVMFRRKDLA